MRDPDPAEIDAVLAAGGGAIRMVTLAPELPGSDEAIRRFLDAGVVVAVGHTDATYEQTEHAIALGATVGTHLFNAMPPLHHREPGPALALLRHPGVTVELIADGVHVHPAVVHAVIGAAGPDRVAVITDAIAAAGRGDGAFRLGAVAIDVVSGVARVRGTSTIAGSTATMDRLFRNRARAGPGRRCGAGRRGADDRGDAGAGPAASSGWAACAPAMTPILLCWIVICGWPRSWWPAVGGWAASAASGSAGKRPARQRLPPPSRSASDAC